MKKLNSTSFSRKVFPVCFNISILFSLLLLMNCGSDSPIQLPDINLPPEAIASADAESGDGYAIGGNVLLNGGSSSDPDGDAITYLWEFISQPSSSSATINNATNSLADFTIDAAGDYIVRLTVSDGNLTDTDQVTISVTQQAIVAELRIENDITEAPLGTTIVLTPNGFEGSNAVDLSGYSVVFEFTSSPSASTATFVDSGSSGDKEFTLDKAGDYTIRVTITDLADASRTSFDDATVSTSAPSDITFDPIFGKPGDLITVSGTGLSAIAADNTVLIGATASVTAATSYPNPQLTVQVPVGAGTGPITVLIGSDQVASTDTFYAYPGLTVSTLAGSTMGNQDGTGPGAQFNGPYGITYFESGDKLYVTDQGNNTIREISSSGVVSTLAGDGTGAFLDGPVASAQFFGPQGIIVDASDVVYVADNDNNRIRRINSTHTSVNTLAGDGTNADLDGTGTGAQFSLGMFDMVIDNTASIFLTASTTHVIRKIDGAAAVTTFAGSGSNGDSDGNGTSATLSEPAGLAIDGNNTLYLADAGNNKIKMITSSGDVTTLAGNNNFGLVDGISTAEFNQPTGMAIDEANGIVYIADFGNNSIRQYIIAADLVMTIAGHPTGLAGSTDGDENSATFNGPLDIVIDASGNLYVTDYMNHRIRKITFD